MSKIIYDMAQVAAVALTAHREGRSMSEAVATRYGIERRNASKVIARARVAGYAIPLDHSAHHAPPAPADPSAVRRAVTVGASAITREEYYRRTAHMDRPLTESGCVSRRQGVIGQLLAGQAIR